MGLPWFWLEVWAFEPAADLEHGFELVEAAAASSESPLPGHGGQSDLGCRHRGGLGVSQVAAPGPAGALVTSDRRGPDGSSPHSSGFSSGSGSPHCHRGGVTTRSTSCCGARGHLRGLGLPPSRSSCPGGERFDRRAACHAFASRAEGDACLLGTGQEWPQLQL